jgi:capsular exopolysaccharide synthesis family protein
MEKEERLLPVPPSASKELQVNGSDMSSSYAPVYDEDVWDERRPLRDYFNVVVKRLPLIVTIALVTTAAVAFYMYRQPSIYMASTRMVIEPKRPKVQAKDAININFGNDPQYMNTQLQLLSNPELMRSAVIRLGLHKDPKAFAAEQSGVISYFRKLFSGGGGNEKGTEATLPVLTGEVDPSGFDQDSKLTPDEKQRADNYAAILLGGLKISPVEKTNIVNVNITSTNADVAPKVADAVAELFIQKNAEQEVEGAQKAFEQLTKSIEDLKTTIALQEAEFITQMKSAQLPLQEGRGTNLLMEDVAAIQKNLNRVAEERQKLEQEIDSINLAKSVAKKNPDLSPDRIGQNIRGSADPRGNTEADELRQIDSEIAKANAELAKLRVKYTDEHPPVRMVIEQLKGLEEQRREQAKKVGAESETRMVALNAQKETFLRQERELRAQYVNAVNTTNQQGQAEMQLTTLDREIKTNRGLLDTYIQRQKEQELAIASGRPENLRVDAPAQRSALVGPLRSRNIIVALLLSLAVGIGLAFLLDYLDDSIKTSDDVGRHLGLPTLALIPHHGDIGRKLKLGRARSNLPAKPMSALVSLEDTRSATAEAYRHLRTSLLFSSAGKPPQTILVTSSQPSEGKTTTAINTAITLAQSGAEVVIVDCDLRRPRLHSHFNLTNTLGLTNYLSGENDPDALLKSYEGVENLKIITSGPIPPNPAELLGSDELKNLIDHLRNNFQHVILDSPPAISFTDAAILSTVADGVVLVAMAGKSSIQLMRRFKQRLTNIGARIYGIVLNGIRSDSVEYGYYGYSYSYYDAPADDSTPRMEEKE